MGGPTCDLFPTSGILFLGERLFQLETRYLTKAIRRSNPFIFPLVSEYIRSKTAIKARYITPLCLFAALIAILLH